MIWWFSAFMIESRLFEQIMPGWDKSARVRCAAFTSMPSAVVHYRRDAAFADLSRQRTNQAERRVPKRSRKPFFCLSLLLQSFSFFFNLPSLSVFCPFCLIFNKSFLILKSCFQNTANYHRSKNPQFETTIWCYIHWPAIELDLFELVQVTVWNQSIT